MFSLLDGLAGTSLESLVLIGIQYTEPDIFELSYSAASPCRVFGWNGLRGRLVPRDLCRAKVRSHRPLTRSTASDVGKDA